MIYTVTHDNGYTRMLLEDIAVPSGLPTTLPYAGAVLAEGVWTFKTDKLPLIRHILGLAYSHGHGNPLWEDATDELRSIRAKILARLAAYDRLLGDNEPCESATVDSYRGRLMNNLQDWSDAGIDLNFLEAHTTRELAALAARLLPDEEEDNG